MNEWSENKKKILIMTPCYNEQETINKFHKTVTDIVKDMTNDYDIHILYVNDGSKDMTQIILEDLVKTSDVRTHYITFSRNFGKEAAMLAGFEYSYNKGYDATIVMDTDLQDDPSLIKEMISKWEEGYQHIYTKHKNRKGESFLKKVFSKAFYKVYAKLTGIKNMAQGARDYSLLDKKVVEAYIKFPDVDRFTKGISTWVGFKKYCIEFDYAQRCGGKTKWSFKKLFKYAILGINQFSDFLKYIPRILMVIFSLLLAGDIVRVSLISNGLNFFSYFDNTNIRIDIVGLLLSVAFSGIYKVTYDTKKQATKRPIYLISRTDEE